MKISNNVSLVLLGIYLTACSGDAKKSNTQDQILESESKDWIIGPFVRPEGKNPIIKPIKESEFFCPMRKQTVRWEESDVFNPAATVKDGRVVVLYRAEDNSATGIGRRTSRIGYAESSNGVSFVI